jgi:hypothetical protein
MSNAFRTLQSAKQADNNPNVQVARNLLWLGAYLEWRIPPSVLLASILIYDAYNETRQQ